MPPQIDHVIVLMMENRSFDHYLGWLPGADGRQAGLKYKDRTGKSVSTHRLTNDFQGCAFADPDRRPPAVHAGRARRVPTVGR